MARLSTFSNAEEFLRFAEPFLRENEALNHMILGNAIRARSENKDIRAWALQNGESLLLAFRIEGRPLTLAGNSTELAAELANYLHMTGTEIPFFLSPSQFAAPFLKAWTASGGKDFVSIFTQLAYELKELKNVPEIPGQLWLATEKEARILERFYLDFHFESHRFPMAREIARSAVADRIKRQEMYLWQVDGKFVAMGGKDRPTGQSMALNMIFTHAQHRGKGYGKAISALICQDILENEKQDVTLYADLANPVSNAIYQKLGFKPTGELQAYRQPEKKEASQEEP